MGTWKKKGIVGNIYYFQKDSTIKSAGKLMEQLGAGNMVNTATRWHGSGLPCRPLFLWFSIEIERILHTSAALSSLSFYSAVSSSDSVHFNDGVSKPRGEIGGRKRSL